jgi:pimeloyl-ACP methyl ester carboxylesterase
MNHSHSDAGEQAFRLFMTAPARAEVRPAHRPVHERAVVGGMSFNGGEVKTYRWGDGTKPVLLVHGVGGRASNFAALVPGIEELGLTAVAFDAPGHGDSEGMRVSTILEYRDIILQLQERYRQFHAIIGHSFGGTSIYLAARSGARTRRLVSIDCFADFAQMPVIFGRQAGLSPELVDRAARVGRAARPEDLVSQEFRVDGVPHRVRHHACRARPDPRRARPGRLAGFRIGAAVKTVQARATAISPAARSAMPITAALMLVEGKTGMTDASTTLSPCTPRTRRFGSTTAMSSVPMRQVPAGCHSVPALRRT